MATRKKKKPAKPKKQAKKRAVPTRKAPKKRSPAKPKAATKLAPARKRAGARGSDREDPATAAAELITLERQLQAGSGDPALFNRWVALVKLVLGSSDGPHSRRSVRLPAGVPIRLGIRRGEFTCQLTDLSQLGLTVTGPVLSHVSVGEPIEVRSIGGGGRGGRGDQSGDQLPVGVLCDIVRIDNGKTPAVAGLRLARENDAASQRRFFDAIYYPLYIAYLEQTAQGARA